MLRLVSDNQFCRAQVSDKVCLNSALSHEFLSVEGRHNSRPDLIVFVNGLPLAVIELKSALDEDATIWSAWNQLQTYQQQIPSLFVFNELLVMSDGLNARLGSLSAGKEWF